MLRSLLVAVVASAAVAGPASAAVTGTVTIGLAASQSGPAAAYGASQALGARLAVDTLDASGGLGFTLALATSDDASTADGATAAFRSLLAQGAAALLGPTLSGAALAADPLVQAAARPLVAISNTADGITAAGSYVFRASLLEREQIPGAVRVAHRRLRFRRPVMVVRTDQPFAVAGAAAFRTALRGVGAPIAAEASYTGAPASFRAMLERLARRHPDALVIESLSEGPQLMRAARAIPALRHVTFLGGNALNSRAVIRAAGAAAEGLVVGAAWHPDEPGAASRAFAAAYRRRFGRTADQFAAQAYTGVLVLARAIRAAGAVDGPAVRDALARTHDLASPLGPFSFDARRGAVAPGVVQIVRHGRFELLR